MRLEHKRRERPLSWPEGGKEDQRAAVANVEGSARRRQPKLPEEERLLKEKYDGMKLEERPLKRTDTKRQAPSLHVTKKAAHRREGIKERLFAKLTGQTINTFSLTCCRSNILYRPLLLSPSLRNFNDYSSFPFRS